MKNKSASSIKCLSVFSLLGVMLCLSNGANYINFTNLQDVGRIKPPKPTFPTKMQIQQKKFKLNTVSHSDYTYYKDSEGRHWLYRKSKPTMPGEMVLNSGIMPPFKFSMMDMGKKEVQAKLEFVREHDPKGYSLKTVHTGLNIVQLQNVPANYKFVAYRYIENSIDFEIYAVKDTGNVNTRYTHVGLKRGVFSGKTKAFRVSLNNQNMIQLNSFLGVKKIDDGCIQSFSKDDLHPNIYEIHPVKLCDAYRAVAEELEKKNVF